MISILQWTALLFSYFLYLLLGAAVFLYTESKNESDNLKALHKLQVRLTLASSYITDADVKEEILTSLGHLEDHFGKELLLPKSYQHILEAHVGYLQKEVNKSSERIHEFDDILLHLNHRIDPSFTYEIGSLESNDSHLEILENITGIVFKMTPYTKEFAISNGNRFEDFWENIEVADEVIEDEKMWNIWNSFFFAFTDITTIGFGHMYPKTDAGQGFCLLYSIIGVPFNGIVFAGLADLFASKIIKRYGANRYKDNTRIALDMIVYLVPGLLVFFFLPAIVFTVVEGWSYLSSLYFTFIALSTIGFGELVAGYPSEEGPWIWPYRIMIQLWIIFGLGYLIMLLAFIQKALRSKQFRAFDRKLGKVLKLAGALPNNQKDLQTEVQKLACILKSIDHIQDPNEIVPGELSSSSSFSTTTTTSFSPVPFNAKEKISSNQNR